MQGRGSRPGQCRSGLWRAGLQRVNQLGIKNKQRKTLCVLNLHKLLSLLLKQCRTAAAYIVFTLYLVLSRDDSMKIKGHPQKLCCLHNEIEHAVILLSLKSVSQTRWVLQDSSLCLSFKRRLSCRVHLGFCGFSPVLLWLFCSAIWTRLGYWCL